MSSSVRLEKLQAIMDRAHLDAVAFVPGSNLRYLTGAVHFLMERPLVLFVPLKGEPVAVMPNLETELFLSQGFKAKLFEWHDADGYDHAFESALKELKLAGKTLGVEGQRMRYFEAEALLRHEPNVRLTSADKAISELRLIKDAAEIALMRQAVHFSEEALRLTLKEVKVGMTEMQLANLLDGYLTKVGGQGLAFSSLVLAGENSARPHGQSRDDYHIKAGDPLLFDYGTTYRGYNSDITRTVFVGQPSDHFRDIYEAVKLANQVGRDAVKPSVTADFVDVSSLQALKDKGFEALIVHKTGHGLGMDVHEHPYIMRGNMQQLQAGMTFTIEPGLYESGAIGVRIEDNVVVTETGGESLSTLSRELTIVG